MKDEVSRFKKFQLVLIGESIDIDVTDKGIKNYVKFILKNGSLEEKRNLLESIKSRFIIKQKKVMVTNKKSGRVEPSRP
jgi:hypothetical protein